MKKFIIAASLFFFGLQVSAQTLDPNAPQPGVMSSKKPAPSAQQPQLSPASSNGAGAQKKVVPAVKQSIAPSPANTALAEPKKKKN